MAARIGPHPDPKKNVWRISYGEIGGLSDEELLQRQPMKFEKMLPGHPTTVFYWLQMLRISVTHSAAWA